MATTTRDLVMDAKDLSDRLQVHTVYPDGGNPHLMQSGERALAEHGRHIGRFLIWLAAEDGSPSTEDLKERLCTALQISPSRWRTILELPVSGGPGTTASIASLADPTTGALHLFLKALHSFVSGEDSQDDDYEIPSQPSTGSWQHEALLIGGELIRLHNTAPTILEMQNDPERFMQYVNQIKEVGERASKIERLPDPELLPIDWLVDHTFNLADEVQQQLVEYSVACLGGFWEGLARGTWAPDGASFAFEGIQVDEARQTLSRGGVVSVWGGFEGWRVLLLLIKAFPHVVTMKQISPENCRRTIGDVKSKLVQDGFEDLADRIKNRRGVGYRLLPAPDTSED